MKRFTAISIGTALSLIAWHVGIAPAQDQGDVIFTTPFRPGERPKTADFFYNDRAIGRDREAFEVIVNRIRKLPPATSIVWGPNYDRCGSCSGSEPGCLPKHLYPDLWNELEAIASERRLTISSSYPRPWLRPTKRSVRGEFPRNVFSDHSPRDEPFDAILDWQVGEGSDDIIDTPPGTEYAAGRLHRFACQGMRVAGFDRRLFFGKLAKNSRVLVRLTLREPILENDKRAQTLARNIVDAWESIFSEDIRCGALQTSIAVPSTLAEALQERLSAVFLNIEWQNFHGPGTPHSEVLYLANDAYVGRGDEGFSQILKRLNNLPMASTVILPRYQLRGRAVLEGFLEAERSERNARLKDLVPFQTQSREFRSKIASRQLRVEIDEIAAGTGDDTVLSWDAKGRHTEVCASFGRILRFDEPPQPAAARLAWVRYDASDKHTRKLETTACYVVNDVEMGEGVEGFAKAMQQFASLPEGSVVQVRVCLRTKGPFVCPLTYDGQRHFERTGYEPYFAMLPWLVDVANTRKLKIEWLPDEAKSCADCQLNR